MNATTVPGDKPINRMGFGAMTLAGRAAAEGELDDADVAALDGVGAGAG